MLMQRNHFSTVQTSMNQQWTWRNEYSPWRLHKELNSMFLLIAQASCFSFFVTRNSDGFLSDCTDIFRLYELWTMQIMGVAVSSSMFCRRLVGHLSVTSNFVADFEDSVSKNMTIIKIAQTKSCKRYWRKWAWALFINIRCLHGIDFHIIAIIISVCVSVCLCVTEKVMNTTNVEVKIDNLWMTNERERETHTL